MDIIANVLLSFGLPVSDIQCERIGTGHINETFKVYSAGCKYILQKLNTDIFKKPEYIMNNISAAQYLIKKGLVADGKADRKFPEYLEAKGKNYLIMNGFWRIYPYIDSVPLKLTQESAAAFGRLSGEFHRYTEGADISALYITIPDFHNIEKNISALLECRGIPSEERKLFSEFIDAYRKEKKFFSPKRLVHNDIKLANVLTDPKTLMPETIIDYDTIMPGYAAFDFGDAVRSLCITDNGTPDINMIKSFSSGYFSEYGKLNETEAAAGILAVTAELAARYLYDRISGNNYFSGMSDTEKTDRYYKNMKLAKYVYENYSFIKDIILMAKKNSV